MSNTFNQQVIEEFRANNGRVGGYFEGARLLLLTTVGARSGAPHTVPLGYLPDGGEQVLVIGSAGGSHKHPAWFHNVRANPSVTVEDGVFTYGAHATVLKGEERDAAFARACEADPGWAQYQSQTSRALPVVALTETTGGPPHASSPGAALKLVHDVFRRELEIIRAEITESGTTLGAQLRVNCLTLCRGLHGHHTREDQGLFPYFAANNPALAPTLARLEQEHLAIGALLGQLKAALADTTLAPQQLGASVDQLTRALEQHLDYEEAQLIPVLDGTTAG